MSRRLPGANAERRRRNGERRTTSAERQADPRSARRRRVRAARVVALARWTAEYYAAGVGETIPALLPPKARGGRADAHKTTRVAAITAAGLEALDVARGSANAPDRPRHRRAKQREALELLAGTPTGIATPALAARGIAADAISRLARHGYISLRQDRVDRDPFAADRTRPTGRRSDGRSDRRSGRPSDRPRQLTGEQAAALERLLALAATGEFRVALLHGVTGSGKTEIYIRLVGRGPRGRTPRADARAGDRADARRRRRCSAQAFGERVAIQHSGLSDGERHDQWQRIRRGDIDVVVGTRSAVFAPLEQVGLIVVDEEHDGSYKQEESPRYNGRDVAIVRAQRAGALVVLGSATPSMETYHNAMAGKYERVVLERRVLDRPLAAVTVVDMREEYAAEGPGRDPQPRAARRRSRRGSTAASSRWCC